MLLDDVGACVSILLFELCRAIAMQGPSPRARFYFSDDFLLHLSLVVERDGHGLEQLYLCRRHVPLSD